MSWTLQEIQTIASIFAYAGTFLFGLASVVLTYLAFKFRLKESFYSELQREQFAEMKRIRHKLNDIFFDIGYLPMIKNKIELFEWSLDDLRMNEPDEWEQYQRYKTNSLELFYKLNSPEYFLFPEWIERDRIKRLEQHMVPFAPFTLRSAANKSDDQIKAYQNELLGMASYIDRKMRENM